MGQVCKVDCDVSLVQPMPAIMRIAQQNLRRIMTLNYYFFFEKIYGTSLS
jgi:hypothetical protein